MYLAMFYIVGIQPSPLLNNILMYLIFLFEFQAVVDPIADEKHMQVCFSFSLHYSSIIKNVQI